MNREKEEKVDNVLRGREEGSEGTEAWRGDLEYCCVNKPIYGVCITSVSCCQEGKFIPLCKKWVVLHEPVGMVSKV